MSTLKVTAERLVVHEHPNADALELAQVGLYRAVVPKGVYHTGDYAIYIPEQAILPPGLIEELGLVGRLAGSNKNRVKAVRLRGELSQGIVCLPEAIVHPGMDGLETAFLAGTDFADELGIIKWAPPVPVHMAGKVVAAPDLLPWGDIENLKRYPDIFDVDEGVVATEKVHGTCCLLTYVVETGELFVTSKGYGEKRLAILEDEGNVYWRAIRAYEIPELAKQIARIVDVARVGIFGEVYGKGVQDLHYGQDAGQAPGYVIFDISVSNHDGSVAWLNPVDMMDVLDDARHDDSDLPMVHTVPWLYAGPFDLDEIMKVVDGKEEISGQKTHLREGIVIRPLKERHSNAVGGRAIAKVVSDAYLTRHGGTEYE